MDLSDGSDVEECIDDVDQDAENVLLGSDDEEFTRNINASHGLGEDNDDKVLETDEEEEDVLELALDADEELDEFVEKQQPNCNRIAPVKVRMQENVEKSIHPSCSESRSQSTSDNPHSTGLEEEDDTESDPKNTRSRFLTERKTEDINSGSASIGNPIQILGERKVRNPDLRQPKNWGNQRPQPSRQFNRGPRGPLNRQSLLGDAPRHQGFRPRFPNANEAPIVQFQERIFTDFNQPIPQTQQQINNNRLAAPMHNAPVGKPQNPIQGSPARNNHNNQPGNRHRPFNPNGPFMDPSNRGPQPRGQNLEPRQRHPHDQQWKNRQPGGGVPPAVSGVHPAVIISGNVGPPPFQGPNPGHGNNQHMSPPNQGPPPHLMPHGPGPNNVNLGPPPQHGQMRPGQNMGGHHHNMKRPPKGANNMQGPGNNHNQRGPPNIPNLRGHPPHGPGIQNQIPNHQGPPIGPNMHGHPQGPHQGPNMHIIPQEPPVNVPQGGPNLNHHGPPQGHGPGPHGMVRPINNIIHPGPPGVPPSHPPNQNFGPPPNNLAHGHQVRPPFEGPPGVNNQGHMQHQKPPFHMEQHHGHPNDRPEMNFGHPPRHPNPQMNPRPPFVNHHPRFGSPPRHPGPQTLEMGQNGPYFHQQPGPPMQREHEHPPHPQFWNGPQGPQGPPGHQDPHSWNQNPQLPEHLPRNVGVQQVPNMEMEFRHGGPPVDQYQGPSHVPVNEPSSSQYEPHQYQNYASEAPIYNDGSQVRPAYEQQQHLNYYQQGSDQVHFDQFGREIVNPGSHLSMVVNGHNDDRYESEKGITRTIVLSNIHEQYLSYPQESERSNDYYQSDRRSVKRKSESNYEYHSPTKTLNSRLGPPVRISDEQHEQAVNIILQTKKEMGIDDEYDKKMEEQKLLRAAILKKKEERRKLTKGGQDYLLDESERDNDRGSSSSRSKYSSRSLTTERSEPPVRNSIYVNPKAFKGNLSLLNSNLKKINMNATTSKSKEAAVQKEKAPSTKPKTVLRIVRNKRGKIISQSKVKILPNEYQDGPSSSKTS